jgi:U3 small nucleolar RNA-associated protein 12
MQGARVAELRDADGATEVSSLVCSSSSRLVAVGHQDGKVRLWERDSLAMRVALDGHRASVAALSFSDDGTLLASGAFDTDIIVWDVVAEAGLYRLRGHKDAVTAVAFIPGGGTGGRLVSASKDSLIKVRASRGSRPTLAPRPNCLPSPSLHFTLPFAACASSHA